MWIQLHQSNWSLYLYTQLFLNQHKLYPNKLFYTNVAASTLGGVYRFSFTSMVKLTKTF